MMRGSLACSGACVLDRRPDARWRHRHVEMFYPEWRKRIEHGVHHTWWCCDRAAFANTFDADRVGGGGRLLKQRSYAGDMFGARHSIVEQRAGHQLTGIGIVADFFIERLRDTLHDAAMNLPGGKQR